MAETGSYFVAAYTIVAVMYVGYAASLWRRRRDAEARRARLAVSSPTARQG